MELVSDVVSNKGSLEGKVFLALFNKQLPFRTGNSVTTEYVQTCVSAFNNLGDEAIDNLCAACIRYCNDFLDAIGESLEEFANPRDVLEKIYPSVFLVPNPENSKDAAFHMELNCDWEEEHGMEWVIRGGEVLYVGAFNDENPWADYSEKSSWNYA